MRPDYSKGFFLMSLCVGLVSQIPSIQTRGKNFEAKIIKEICTLLDIKKTRTTAYHPQSDSLVERFNRTLLGMLSMAVRED